VPFRAYQPIHDRYALTYFPLGNNIASFSSFSILFIKVLMQKRTKIWLMSSDRVATTLIGLALMPCFPLCPSTAALAIPLIVYGLFPRKGVRIRSKAVRLLGKTVGCLALTLSLLLLAGLMMTSAPRWVVLASIVIFSIPSAALTLYGFEIGVILCFSVKVAVYMRVLIVALIPLALGLGIILAYADLMLSGMEFLSGIHEVGMGATKIILPGWILACTSFLIGSFLFILGAIAIVNFKRVAKRIEGSPRPAWIPKRSKASQVFALAISALIIGVGPFIFLKSGVFLAGAITSLLGAYLTLLVVDQQTLKAACEELKTVLRLGPSEN